MARENHQRILTFLLVIGAVFLPPYCSGQMNSREYKLQINGIGSEQKNTLQSSHSILQETMGPVSSTEFESKGYKINGDSSSRENSTLSLALSQNIVALQKKKGKSFEAESEFSFSTGPTINGTFSIAQAKPLTTPDGKIVVDGLSFSFDTSNFYPILTTSGSSQKGTVTYRISVGSSHFDQVLTTDVEFTLLPDF